jgi:hypothetical protein
MLTLLGSSAAQSKTDLCSEPRFPAWLALIFSFFAGLWAADLKTFPQSWPDLIAFAGL